ncbi:cysteine-rich secretory protein 2-like isoform X2 [Uloborus diversus]|uniref:cysteine-rich secretory protein 2-like isoform X2 n=1 Tax=Uloborus diversus TaxID=327109 RepID=UPI00240A791D|nr:cysteine-rich secretory protein 2-like isoform X2 [Uloborus diversus]
MVQIAYGSSSRLEWDNELERLAQIWATKCVFEHGMPDNDYPDTIGQNLYIGTDPTGYNAVWLWYDEYNYYDLKNQYCRPEKQCGHFIQLAWAPSHRLGCGMHKCGMRYLIVCHYSHQALRGVQMYLVAKPCSQCPEKEGALCLKNLCQFAKCDLECHNCGKLDKEKCRCECADGWDSSDCSSVCEDQHKRCGKSPGWPSIAACSLNNHAVAETFCRKMCGKCKPVSEESIPNDACCSGKLCEDGQVTSSSEEYCECVLPCPGPKCEKNMAATEAMTTEDMQEEGDYGGRDEPSTSRGGKLQWNILLFLIYHII